MGVSAHDGSARAVVASVGRLSSVRPFGALSGTLLPDPLAEWLVQWPATGGSAYERLQLALRRIPPAVQQLNAAVTQALTRA